MQAAFVGNLTSDPKVETFQDSGKTKVTVRVAVNDSYMKDGARVERLPLFWQVEWWGDRAAAFAKTVSKGSRVMVQGSFRASEWKDNESGDTRRHQVVAAEAVAAIHRPAPTHEAEAEPWAGAK